MSIWLNVAVIIHNNIYITLGTQMSSASTATLGHNSQLHHIRKKKKLSTMTTNLILCRRYQVTVSILSLFEVRIENIQKDVLKILKQQTNNSLPAFGELSV